MPGNNDLFETCQSDQLIVSLKLASYNERFGIEH
jgi:hypothetical protein